MPYPRRFWNRDDIDLRACATLAGVNPDAGMVNTFNEMEDEGEFDGCRKIGDYFHRWLAYLLADKRNKKDTAPASPTVEAPQHSGDRTAPASPDLE